MYAKDIDGNTRLRIMPGRGRVCKCLSPHVYVRLETGAFDEAGRVRKNVGFASAVVGLA